MSKSDTPQSELKHRDYRQYVSWQIVHLLRSLKVMEALTPIQRKLVEAKSDTMAATINEDITALITKREIELLDKRDEQWFQILINKVGYEEARAYKDALQFERLENE